MAGTWRTRFYKPQRAADSIFQDDRKSDRRSQLLAGFMPYLRTDAKGKKLRHY